jgi:steroid Delta-isomerase
MELEAYVADHNLGVRTGEWEPLLRHFASDAELAFEGVPVGPFLGREAIGAAYRSQPPDDEVVILDAREDRETIVAGYGWSREPGVRAGEMRLTHDGETVTKLVVTFD